MYNPKPITIPEMLISLGIIIVFWCVVIYWEKKKIRDRAKRNPSAVRRLDEFEDKISS